MLTPFFSVSQDDEFVFVDVKVSHVRFSAKAIEMSIDKQVFVFSLPPYYLRLRFPHNCVDDERSHAEFDSKSDTVKIKLPKETKGQAFPDLDLTAKLLARTNELTNSLAAKKPIIEELDIDHTIKDTNTIADEGLQHDWEVEQELPELMTSENKYGFNNEYNDIIGVSVSNGNDINDLADPENTIESQRIMERLIKENIKFDPEYYAADYMMAKDDNDEKEYKVLMQWKNPYTIQFGKWFKKEDKEQIMPVEFTKSEQEKMLELPKKSYLVSPHHKSQLLNLIVSVLFAYHFDLRETCGDHHVESAWTVGRLVPQIACLDAKLVNDETSDSPLKAAIIAGYRRSLCYPLHRNYELSRKVWDDVYYNLRGGKRFVLKCLLAAKELFRFHDVYYVYDIIWFKDLLAWLISEQVSEMDLRQLAHDVKRTVDEITKDVIVFEKGDPEYQEPDSDDEGDEEDADQDGDELIPLSIREIEMMAEDI